MNDLISRKALLEELSKWLEPDFNELVAGVFKEITNAPTVEQGEPVAYIHKHYLNEDKNALDWHKREHPQFEMISLYTAPPQSLVQHDDEVIELVAQDISRIMVNQDWVTWVVDGIRALKHTS